MILRDYQEVGVDWILSKKRSILADQTGTGKTLQCLEAIKRSGKKTLIVAPKYVCNQWKIRAEAYGFKVAPVFGDTKAKKIKACKLIDEADVVITNYETFTTNLTELTERGWEFVVLDEAQFIQGRKSRRTVAIKKLINGRKPTEFVVLATASPVWNQGNAVWSLLHALYPARFRSYWDFVNKFCVTYQTPFGTEIRGMNQNNLPEFRALLKEMMIRRRKRDVIKELPPMVQKEIELETDKKLQKENSHIRKMMKEDGYLSLMRLRTHLLDRASFEFNEDERLFSGEWPSAKREALERILENEMPNKILVFVVYKDSARMALNWVKEIGYGWSNEVPITGDLSVSERERIIEEFKNAEGLGVLVGSYRTLGTGIDLQFASVLVLLEHPHLYVELDQAIGRIERIGAVDPLTVYHLIQDTKIDKRVYKACKDREMLTDSILLKET